MTGMMTPRPDVVDTVDATDAPARPTDAPPRRAPVGARLFETVNRVVAPVARSGLAGPLPVGAGLVMVRTAGRRTGLPREVPVLSLRLGHLLMVGTVRRDSQWIRNLAADPEPEVWLGGRRRPANATVRTGPVGVAVLDLLPGGVRAS